MRHEAGDLLGSKNRGDKNMLRQRRYFLDEVNVVLAMVLVFSGCLGEIPGSLDCPAGQVSTNGACRSLCSPGATCGDGQQCTATGVCDDVDLQSATLSITGVTGSGSATCSENEQSLCVREELVVTGLGLTSANSFRLVSDVDPLLVIDMPILMASNKKATLALPGNTRFESYTLTAVNAAGDTLASQPINLTVALSRDDILARLEGDARVSLLLNSVSSGSLNADRAGNADRLAGKTLDEIKSALTSDVLANLPPPLSADDLSLTFIKRTDELDADTLDGLSRQGIEALSANSISVDEVGAVVSSVLQATPVDAATLQGANVEDISASVRADLGIATLGGRVGIGETPTSDSAKLSLSLQPGERKLLPGQVYVDSEDKVTLKCANDSGCDIANDLQPGDTVFLAGSEQPQVIDAINMPSDGTAATATLTTAVNGLGNTQAWYTGADLASFKDAGGRETATLNQRGEFSGKLATYIVQESKNCPGTCGVNTKVTCHPGDQVLSGGCRHSSSSTQARADRPFIDGSTGNQGWHCGQYGSNFSTAVATTAYAICLRTP
jgi:hypothetical protein